MNSVRLRPAVPADATLLHAWDREPHVIRAVTDDPATLGGPFEGSKPAM